MAVPQEKPSTSAIIKPNIRGTVTIPKEFRAAWDLESTVLEVVLRDDGVIELRPRVLLDPARLAGYEQWERQRAAFFQRWEQTARHADLPPDEAEQLADEAIGAARQGTSR